jgi:hypothetical protein
MRMRWAGYVVRVGYKMMVKLEGKRPLGGQRLRLVDNIKMDGVIKTGLFWLRIGMGGGLLRTVMNIQGCIKCS